MGFLTDLRSDERLGGCAMLFWICACIAVGSGLGVYLVGYSETMVPVFALIGALTGACIGFYAASAKTGFPRFLALPGYLFVIVVGLLEGGL
jgi:hypothetical protein